MSQDHLQGDVLSFMCATCGKRFRWRPEIAGRKGKCGCGAIFQAPMTMSAAAAPDDLYDIVETPQSPAPSSVAASPAVAPAADASAIASSLGVALPGRRFQPVVEEEEKPESQLFNLILPIVAIAAGMVLSFVAKAYGADPHSSASSLLPGVMIGVVANLALVVGAMFAVSAAGGIAFVDPPWRLILKLCACALAPGAVGQIIFYAMGGSESIGASIAGVFASLALYTALFKLFFKLDIQDTVICVMSVIIIKSFVEYGLYKFEGWRTDSWV